MYTLPDGSRTEDKHVHARMWDQYVLALQARIPGVSAVRFEPDTFTLKLRDGEVTLPRWFVAKLVENTRTLEGRKFKPESMRAKSCEMCQQVMVYTFGPGRDRRFCPDCVKVRAKMRRGGDDD